MDEKLYIDLSRVYGSLLDSLIEAVMRPPARLYIRVNTLRIQPGELLDRLRRRGLDARQDPYLREALYFPLKRIAENLPLLPGRIVVDRYAAESIMMGANVYAPGVIDAEGFGRGDTVSVIDPWGRVVAHAEAVVGAHEARRLTRGLVAYTSRPLYKAPAIRDLPEYGEGLFYPQGVPSMAAAHILRPMPGEKVIDMNAAPGGKTSHFIEYSGGLAHVFAFERSWAKAARVMETIRRLRIPGPVVMVYDSRYSDRVLVAADKVLIDPPCTGLGVRPKARLTVSWRDAEVAQRYQRQFLEAAARYMPRGSLLLYSTCTLTFIENEVNALHAVGLGFESIEADEAPPYSDKVYYGDLVAYRFNVLGHDTPGHFYALLRRR